MSSVSSWYTSTSSKLRKRMAVVAMSDIDEDDKSFIVDILMMRTALLTDLTVGSTSQEETCERWRRTIRGLQTLDVGQYSSDWKIAREIITSDEFLDAYPNSATCRQRFKHAGQKRIHYKWIQTSILALIEGEEWFAAVNQWITFDSRANLRSLDLTNQECLAYLDFERSMAEWRYEGRLLRVAQRAARDMFGDLNFADYPFRPHHGNGATAEVSRQNADVWHKNRQFKVDSEVITYLKYRIPEADWHDWFYVPYKGLSRRSTLVCVPKSMTKNRTISKEPTTLQYLQQDLFQCFDDYFAEHLSDRINLHDQERSRTLAKVGSSDGSYATIDLSAASDSVTVQLIEALFGGLPCLYPLLATRSTDVHVLSNDGSIDETIVGMQKFAPMGSAVCFPVECCVFALMCEVAVRETTGRRSRKYDYVVYGDDIVIRSTYAKAVIKVLEYFHFTVNTDKSFINDVEGLSYFREACGVECLDGEDVTPLRLSRRLVSLTRNDSDRLAGQGVGMVDLLNRAYLYGYRNLRRWINDVLIHHKWYRTIMRLDFDRYEDFVRSIEEGRPSWLRVTMPFVIVDPGTATQWRSFGCRFQLNGDIQTPLARITVARVRPKRQHHDENDYFTWCLEKVTRKAVDRTFEIDDTQIVTIRPRDLKWSQTWIPVIDGVRTLFALVRRS